MPAAIGARRRVGGVVWWASLWLLLVASACAGGDQQERLDVTPRVSLPDSVALREPLHIGYAWAPGAEFQAPANDYKVFVHFLDPSGRIVLQDDHYPPQPTSQWRADRTEEYQRWVYPGELEFEAVDIVVGLYTGDGRVLVRDADGSWSDAVRAHRLQIRADDMSGMPVYMDGWHGEEEGEQGRWRWCEGTARVVFTNPHGDAVLHLRAHGPYDELGRAQTVLLRTGEHELARFQVTSAEPFLRRVEVPAEVMGEEDWVEVTIETTPVLVPAERDPSSSDEWQLALQVFMLYLSSS